jgi:ABC-2 type transport system permease protein
MTSQPSATGRSDPAVSVRRADAVSGSIGATLGREINATFAIAWREILRAVKSPVSIAFTIIFPILFIGILGGSISQNLGNALPYAYLPFMLIGMIANTMYQGTITGVTNLVEERENDFTAELFVAPISRYAVLLGKLIGSGIAALVSLVGIVAMIFVMQIPMDAGDLLRVVALSPVLALAGGSLGILFIGITQDPKVVSIGVPLLIFPQMFLSGALIPIGASSGILAVLAKIIPMTYSIDLARNIFYWGKPEYHATVLHDPWLDLAITVGFFLVFTLVGTWLFVRADRNR